MAYKVATDTIAFREGRTGEGEEIPGAEFTIRRYLSKQDMDDYRTAVTRLAEVLSVEGSKAEDTKTALDAVETVLMRTLRAVHGVELDDGTAASPENWRKMDDPMIVQIMKAIRERNFEPNSDEPKGQSPNA